MLSEFSEETFGFERESHFVTMGQAYIPGVHFINTPSLNNLDVETGSFDFAMTHVVLQHLSNEDAQTGIGEMKRIVGNGYILLAERVGEPRVNYAQYDETKFWVDNRPIIVWKEWMHPWLLKQDTINSKGRGFDPDRGNLTHFMLFANA